MTKRILKWLAALTASPILLFGTGARPIGLPAHTTDPAGFDHLSVADGLSDSSTLDILQDDQGFMWFATQNGLNRYDGYEFVIFKHDPNDPNSLSHNNIRTLLQDEAGMLWIGTRGGGLNRLDLRTGEITRFQHDPADPESIASNFINGISTARPGSLWICTNNGLGFFDVASGRSVSYRPDPTQAANPEYLVVNDAVTGQDGTVWVATNGGLAWLTPGAAALTISSSEEGVNGTGIQELYLDEEGFLWAAGEDGLFKLDDARRVLAHYQHNPDDLTGLGPGGIQTVYPADQGGMWLGLRGGGLSRFDPGTESFTHFRHNPEDPSSLPNEFILRVYEDRSGTLWVSNWTAGLSLLSPYRFKFPPPIRLPSIPLAFLEEDSGSLWVGTLDQGLAYIDAGSGEIAYYRHDPANAGSLSNDSVFALEADANVGLWAGTLAGLNYFDPATKSFTRYLADPENPAGLFSDSIRSLHLDDMERLWLGTESGLQALDTTTGQFSRFVETAGGPGTIDIWTIQPAGPVSLWIGADNGLFLFDRNTGEFQDLSLVSGSRDIGIMAIHQDAAGLVWLGTWGQGLIRFDPDSKTSKPYQRDAGLPGDIVLGILPDADGSLWLSTNQGLSVFDPAAEQFRTYTKADGLADDDFAQGASLVDRQGEMLLGVENAIIRFYPERLENNPYAPPVYLTHFQLFNQEVPVDADSLLSRNINYTSELVLDHDDSVFSFEFAGLNFVNPSRNQYAYRMEGVDPDWNEVGDRRFVTYTNLDPGEYLFSVRAANNDGIWSEEAVNLKIRVLPPWWQTKGAYLLYVLALVLLIAGLVTYRGRAQARALARQRQELLWERRLRESLEQMDRMKDEERSRIAGELHDGVAQTLAGIRFRSRTWKKIAKQNPEQLLTELDELSDMLDASIKDVRRSIYALRPLTLEDMGLETAIMQLTQQLGKLYQVNITCDLQLIDDLPARLEHDLFRIIQELVYNAVQHGRPQSASVQIRAADNFLSLQVQDDGVGFDPDHLATRSSEGHFGLLLVRERVQTLDGEMNLASRPEAGTTVSVRLPLRQDRENDLEEDA